MLAVSSAHVRHRTSPGWSSLAWLARGIAAPRDGPDSYFSGSRAESSPVLMVISGSDGAEGFRCATGVPLQ